MTTIPDAAQSVIDRFGCSPMFVRLHWGPHTCIDGKPYEARCVFTDPGREAECLALLLLPATPTISGH